MVAALFNRVAFVIIGLAVSTSAFAQAPEQKVKVNICGAGKSGTYIKVAKYIKYMAGSQKFDVTVYETPGSKENVKALVDGRCHLAVIQADATNWYQQVSQTLPVDLKVLANAYTEQAHLVCSRDLKVSSFADLESLSKQGKATIYAASENSGGYMTLENLKAFYPGSYASINLVPVDETRDNAGKITADAVTNSVNHAIAGKACAFFVARAPSSVLESLPADRAAKINLVSLEDRRFDSLRGINGEKVYKFIEFDKIGAIKESARYKDLRNLGGFISTSYTEYTLDIAADVVVNKEWETNMLQSLDQRGLSGTAERWNNILSKVKLFTGNFGQIEGILKNVDSQPLPEAQ